MGWSVAVDYYSLYLHFSLNPDSSILYELQLVLAIDHKCTIVNIKNDAGCNLKYALRGTALRFLFSALNCLLDYYFQVAGNGGIDFVMLMLLVLLSV